MRQPEEIPLPADLKTLAETFPTTAAAMSRGECLTIESLDAYRAKASSGEAYAAIFLLNVFCPPSRDTNVEWESTWPRFDVMGAMGTWDAGHRTAFVAWAKSPWWC